MDLLSCLIETGLTRHEAQLYVLLNTEGVLSGYEAAKHSGMSRSNAYLALAGLTDKGGAVCIDGDVRRFAAVPVQEFCANKRRRLDQVLAAIEAQMPDARAVVEPFLTIKGFEPCLDKMRNMISQAEQRLYIALSETELPLVRDDLADLAGRGRKVVLLTSVAIDIPGVICHRTERQPGQIRLIADSSIILTGEIYHHRDSTCLYSRHQALVTLFKESMLNEIKLIKSS